MGEMLVEVMNPLYVAATAPTHVGFGRKILAMSFGQGVLRQSVLSNSGARRRTDGGFVRRKPRIGRSTRIDQCHHHVNAARRYCYCTRAMRW
jgi:hypothetical protein